MDDCIFCKIIAGQIPASFVYQDDDFVAFLDIRPVNPGHVLLVPRAHASRLIDLPTPILARELPIAARIARGILKITGLRDFNLLNANGAASGQEVFHHHLHIIPRREGDGMNLTIQPAMYGDGEAADLAARISDFIAH